MNWTPAMKMLAQRRAILAEEERIEEERKRKLEFKNRQEEEWPTSSVHNTTFGGIRMTKVLIQIRKNDTGEIREYSHELRIEEGCRNPTSFDYEENNWSCDCNRSLEWERAGGGDPDLDEAECGTGKFSVRLLHPVTRKPFYEEFGEPGKIMWCKTHNRESWRCHREGGILLPCDVEDRTIQ